jgi:hypothetical protein
MMMVCVLATAQRHKRKVATVQRHKLTAAAARLVSCSCLLQQMPLLLLQQLLTVRLLLLARQGWPAAKAAAIWLHHTRQQCLQEGLCQVIRSRSSSQGFLGLRLLLLP